MLLSGLFSSTAVQQPVVSGAGAFSSHRAWPVTFAMQDAFWPIKGSWFSIAENQLFCLLGPNGAGKVGRLVDLTMASNSYVLHR